MEGGGKGEGKQQSAQKINLDLDQSEQYPWGYELGPICHNQMDIWPFMQMNLINCFPYSLLVLILEEGNIFY